MKKLLLICISCMASLVLATGARSESVFVSEEDVHANHQQFLTGARTYFAQLMAGQEHRFNTVMSSVDAYIDFFASQDFTSLPDWELTIMDMVKEGRFTDAIERYETHEMVKEYSSEAIPFDCVERYVMLLQLSGVRSNSMRGLDVLRSICERDTASMAPLRVLVGLCVDLRLHNMADEYLTLYQERAQGDAKKIATK